MKRLAVWLLPVALHAGQARYARVGDFEGQVTVQLQPADDWQPARRNMPLSELARLRTDGPARVEIELDDGNILRLGPDSLAELSDYTRLSSGQRITVISLDHGVAYFTGVAEAGDHLLLALPGAQASVHQPVRLRLEAGDLWSFLSVADGMARFSCPTAQFNLTAGQIVKLDPARPARFSLLREIAPLDTDRWSGERDKLLASTTSAQHVPGLRYGLADLDHDGAWVQTAEFGTIWKPKVPAGWTPFRAGKWDWYDGLGYTWVSDEPWGWLPYHYGRWLLDENAAWMWWPGEGGVFMPGEVYWLKSAKLVGWGPLAPGENWKPPDTPRLFQNANTTYAAYTVGTAEINPAGFTTRPREPLAVAAFAPALPSPPFPAARLEALRPPLRTGGAGPVAVAGPADYSPPPAPAPTEAAYVQPAAPPVVIVNAPPVEVPVEVDVPVPAYLGIIVVYPPGSKNPAPVKPAKPKTPPTEKAAK